MYPFWLSFYGATHQFMDKAAICALLGVVAGVLSCLKLLNTNTSSEELESVVMRAFLEGHLDHRKGMTIYEVNAVCSDVDETG